MKNSDNLMLDLGHELTKEDVGCESCVNDASKIPLWLEVDEFHFWLTEASEKLSQIGNELHHPIPSYRGSRNAALSVLKVYQLDASKREPFVGELLFLAKKYLREPEQQDILLCSIGDKKRSDYVAEEKKRILYSNQQLEVIENLWKFLQVQIKILSIQLRAKNLDEQTFETRQNAALPESSLEYSRGFPLQTSFLECVNETEYDSSTVHERSISKIETITTDPASSTHDVSPNFIKTYFEVSGKDLRFSSWDMHSMTTSHAKATKGTIKLLREEEDVSDVMSPRDDGYHSKTGGSATEDLPSISDALSIDSDSVLQGSSKAHELLGKGRTTLNSTPVVIERESERGNDKLSQHVLSAGSHVSLSSKEWDEICTVVERFSQNTMTLHSWVEELEDVSREEDSPKFYGSQSDRIATVKRHVERVYGDVMEDAATLLRNLTCERSTILAVLKKAELKCRKCGISVGDYISDLSNIVPVKKSLNSDFLSSKIKEDLAVSLISWDEFKPLLTSTPRVPPATKLPAKVSGRTLSEQTETKVGNASLSDTTDIWTHRLSSSVSKMKTHRRKPLMSSSGSSFEVQRNWIEFVNESSVMLEWLRNMEINVLRAEMSSMSLNKLEALFGECLQQLNRNKTKHECLNIKANYVGTMYPELQHDVQNRLSEIDDLWRELKLKLCHYLTPQSMRAKSIGCSTHFYPSRERELSILSDKSYSRPLAGGEWRQHQPFLGTDVQLSDFSFREIRDRLDSGDVRNVGAKPVESDYSDFSSYRTSLESSWIEFEGIEDELGSLYRSRDRRLDISHRQGKPYGKSAFDGVWSRKKKNLQSSPNNRYSLHQTERNRDKNRPTKVLHSIRDEEIVTKQAKQESTDIQKEDKFISENGEPESPSLSSNPYLLSSRITEFHHWLKQMEDEAYKQKAIGWNPNYLSSLHLINRNRILALEHRKINLTRLLSSSKVILDEHNRKVSKFLLLWSTWMLEQRYYNLILYSVDMECILERRSEIIEKGMIGLGLSHPIHGVWSDRGVDMTSSIAAADEDYAIFFNVEL